MATSLLGTDHYIYRKDGRIYIYKVGREAHAGGPESREHGRPDSGEPAIFLHATGGSGQGWKAAVDIMAHHFTCYVVDSPGHDHSDIPPHKYWISDYTDAIVDILDALGLAQTNVVGDHTGSMIAVDLAVKHPGRVKKMVLDGLPYWNGDRGRAIWEKFFMPQFTDTTAYHVPVVPLTTWEEAKARRPNLNRENWEHSEEIHRKSRLWTRLSQEANTSYDTEEAGPKVKVPTLLIYGEGDILRRGEQRANEAIKGSILKVVPGAQGAAHHDKPGEFAKLVIDFLQGKLQG